MEENLRRVIAAYQHTMKMQPSGKAGKTDAGKGADRKPVDPPPAALKPETPKKSGVKTPEAKKTKGLIKTTLPEAPPEPPLPGEESKTRRVAKFLILIGGEQAGKILRELDGEQVEEISREIAAIRGIDPEEAEGIIAEFNSLLAGPCLYSGKTSGGLETARRILYGVYGPEKGEALLHRAVPESKENIFGFLEGFSAEQMVFLLKDESPQAAALVLARLNPKASAEALGKFPPALRPEILKRIARQSDIAPEVLESVAEAMRERARYLGSGGSKDIAIDGMGALAAILRQGDYSFGDRIIGELETESPGIGKDLKDRLYTLDDVLSAFDRPVAEKLKTMTDRAVAVLLKGKSAEFIEKILSNVSAGRRTMIREEGEIAGQVSKRECDEAANDFLAWFRLAREKGEIILSSDEDWV
ncbi:MAG: flagellar motor switch protein FliG [Treponema sp.]|nr:flagellar motor switch protein FliG [Treponema sp.]